MLVSPTFHISLTTTTGPLGQLKLLAPFKVQIDIFMVGTGLNEKLISLCRLWTPTSMEAVDQLVAVDSGLYSLFTAGLSFVCAQEL